MGLGPRWALPDEMPDEMLVADLLDQLRKQAITKGERALLTRTKGALRTEGIETIGQLRRMPAEELRDIPLLGEAAVTFIILAVGHPHATTRYCPTCGSPDAARYANHHH